MGPDALPLYSLLGHIRSACRWVDHLSFGIPPWFLFDLGYHSTGLASSTSGESNQVPCHGSSVHCPCVPAGTHGIPGIEPAGLCTLRYRLEWMQQRLCSSSSSIVAPTQASFDQM